MHLRVLRRFIPFLQLSIANTTIESFAPPCGQLLYRANHGDLPAANGSRVGEWQQALRHFGRTCFHLPLLVHLPWHLPLKSSWPPLSSCALCRHLGRVAAIVRALWVGQDFHNEPLGNPHEPNVLCRIIMVRQRNASPLTSRCAILLARLFSGKSLNRPRRQCTTRSQ